MTGGNGGCGWSDAREGARVVVVRGKRVSRLVLPLPALHPPLTPMYNLGRVAFICCLPAAVTCARRRLIQVKLAHEAAMACAPTSVTFVLQSLIQVKLRHESAIA